MLLTEQDIQPWLDVARRRATSRERALDKETPKEGTPQVDDANIVALRQVQECEQEVRAPPLNYLL